MGYQSFSRPGRATSTTTFFVADKGPTPIINPETGAVEGWNSGYGHMETNSSDRAFNPIVGYRLSNNSVGFHSPNRPFLLKSNSFDYSKQESRAQGFSQIFCTPNSVTNGPGSGGFEASQSWDTNTFKWGFVTDPTSDWLSQLKDKATRNLLQNLRDSSFNAAQAVAERKQTADLIANTAKKVAGALRNLRKGNFGKAARDLGVVPKKRAGRRFNSQYATDQAKAIGNAWLELQYGWKPLLSDVYGSMETLAKANNPRGNPNTIYAKATGRASRSEAKTNRIERKPNSGWTGTDITVQEGNFDVIVKTGVTYSVSSPVLASLKKVGITNPALLAWELLPYSFVVDWFLPIGNYLESLDATNGLSFYDGYVSVLIKKRFSTNTNQSLHQTNGYKHQYRNDSEERTEIKFTRTALGGFPLAPAPTFKNPLSTSHVSSAMALLLQLKR